MSLDLNEVMVEALRRGASDVHLVTGQPPAFRVHGSIESSPRAVLEEADLTRALDAILDDTQRSRWLTDHRLCFSWHPSGLGSFRVSLYSHLGRMEAAIRIAAGRIPSLVELGVPERLLEALRSACGLVLVTGPTGVGKTTTLAALLARIHAEERKKIVTIEDPVEFVLPPGRSLVVQQEVGLDSPSFSDALIHALRQDPDLICVGEMREMETVATALTAAETGHLVLATLHTTGAAGTVSRIVDAFTADQQPQVRTQLAHVLRAVISQKLLPKADGTGRLLVYELLLANDAVRNLIREGRPHLIGNVLATSGAQGMVRMDTMVRDAWLAGEITYDTALTAVADPGILKA